MKWDQAYHFQLFTLSVCCLADAVLVAGIAVLHMKQVVRAACRLPLCSSEPVLIYITILIWIAFMHDSASRHGSCHHCES